MTEHLTRLSGGTPWGLVTARRCLALLQLASQPDQPAGAAWALTEAAGSANMGLRLSGRARSLLSAAPCVTAGSGQVRARRSNRPATVFDKLS